MDALDLATPNLQLRLLDERDRALYRTLYTSPRVMARIAPPLDDAAADQAFATTCLHNGRDRPGHRTWCVVERGAGRSIGLAALLRQGAEAEAGMMLLPAGWNARYSAEVMAALVACAFDRLTVDRLVGRCMAGPAERMARRLLRPHGFTDAPADRAGTARWVLDRRDRVRPVGMRAPDR